VNLLPNIWEPVTLPASYSKKADVVIDDLKKIMASYIDGHKPVDSSDYSISDGFPSLALACSYLDKVFPDEGWDLKGKLCLESTIAAMEKEKSLEMGMFSGLSGVLFSTYSLSDDMHRYKDLIQKLDLTLFDWTRSSVAEILENEEGGVKPHNFDLINGISGVGAYLLYRKETAETGKMLNSVLECIIRLTGDTDSEFKFYDYKKSAGVKRKEINLGLSHGIAGPLALLSSARMKRIKAKNIGSAITHLGEILQNTIIKDHGWNGWPSEANFDTSTMRYSGSKPLTRMAWCYGNPGISRALWLAGLAVKDQGLQELSIMTLKDVYKMPNKITMVDSSTFCHGSAGLAEITMRFFNDTKDEYYNRQAGMLIRNILSDYSKSSVYRFRNVSTDGRMEDRVGILEGMAGVLLVLLAARTAKEPSWDSMFLLK
jgi:lantibiotic biosynthesis protein